MAPATARMIALRPSSSLPNALCEQADCRAERKGMQGKCRGRAFVYSRSPAPVSQSRPSEGSPAPYPQPLPPGRQLPQARLRPVPEHPLIARLGHRPHPRRLPVRRPFEPHPQRQRASKKYQCILVIARGSQRSNVPRSQPSVTSFQACFSVSVSCSR
jgi:hypothetical protein